MTSFSFATVDTHRDGFTKSFAEGLEPGDVTLVWRSSNHWVSETCSALVISRLRENPVGDVEVTVLHDLGHLCSCTIYAGKPVYRGAR
jgi:hypothetical protein